MPKPPRRSRFALGTDGRRAFRRERADWYELATGTELTGSVAEQHENFHSVTRRFRAYSDYRAAEDKRIVREEAEQKALQTEKWYADSIASIGRRLQLVELHGRRRLHGQRHLCRWQRAGARAP